MICYRDMTFCPFWEECKEGETCHRALTKEIQYKADKLSLPICTFVDKPDCFVEKE